MASSPTAIISAASSHPSPLLSTSRSLSSSSSSLLQPRRYLSLGRRAPSLSRTDSRRAIHRATRSADFGENKVSNFEAVPSLYDLLGIGHDVCLQEIRSAFRQLVLKHHPDVCNGSGANARFIEIKEAYETLSSAPQKAQYDEQLKHGSNLGAHSSFVRRSKSGSYSQSMQFDKGRWEEQLNRLAHGHPVHDFAASSSSPSWGARMRQKTRTNGESLGYENQNL